MAAAAEAEPQARDMFTSLPAPAGYAKETDVVVYNHSVGELFEAQQDEIILSGGSKALFYQVTWETMYVYVPNAEHYLSSNGSSWQYVDVCQRLDSAKESQIMGHELMESSPFAPSQDADNPSKVIKYYYIPPESCRALSGRQDKAAANAQKIALDSDQVAGDIGDVRTKTALQFSIRTKQQSTKVVARLQTQHFVFLRVLNNRDKKYIDLYLSLTSARVLKKTTSAFRTKVGTLMLASHKKRKLAEAGGASAKQPTKTSMASKPLPHGRMQSNAGSQTAPFLDKGVQASIDSYADLQQKYNDLREQYKRLAAVNAAVNAAELQIGPPLSQERQDEMAIDDFIDPDLQPFVHEPVENMTRLQIQQELERRKKPTTGNKSELAQQLSLAREEERRAIKHTLDQVRGQRASGAGGGSSLHSLMAQLQVAQPTALRSGHRTFDFRLQ